MAINSKVVEKNMSLSSEAAALLEEAKKMVVTQAMMGEQISTIKNEIANFAGIDDAGNMHTSYRDTAYQDRYQDTVYDDHYKDAPSYRDGTQ